MAAGKAPPRGLATSGLPSALGQPQADAGPRVVLGIDPGTRVAGYGAVLQRADRLELLEAGVIRVSNEKTLPERLGRMAEELERLMVALAPGVVVVERAFAGKNMATALRLGEGRGLALAAAARSGARVIELAPASAKRAIAGNGRAGKAEVAQLVALALGIDAEGAPPDATDALSLALAWLFEGAGPGLLRNARGGPARLQRVALSPGAQARLAVPGKRRGVRYLPSPR